MKFGIALSTESNPGEHPTDRMHAILEDVREAREAGLDSVWIGHHYLAKRPKFQPIPLIARLAPEAGNMNIGTGIFLLAFQNPIDIAEQFASLDLITAGKLILGFGLGHRAEESMAFGFDQREAAKRYSEILTIIRMLWTQEVVDYKGEFFHIKDGSLKLKPIQKPSPPIWIGADLEPGIRRAARYGDSWYPSPRAPPKRLATLVEFYHEELEKLHRGIPSEFPIQRELYLGNSRDEALRQAREFVRWHQEHTGDVKTSELNTERFILGSPRECSDTIRRYVEDFKVTHMVFMIQWPGQSHEKTLETISLIGREIIPEFKS